MDKIIYLIIIFISCVIIGCNRQLVTDQGINLNVLKIVDKLESLNEIHVDSEGITKKGSHKFFQKLIKKASTEELLLLMQHSSSVVRGYSFWALAKRHYEHIDEVLVERAADEELTVLGHNFKKKSYPLIEIMAMIVSSDELDANCKKLTVAELIRFERHRRLVNLVSESKEKIKWPRQDIEVGQRKILNIKYTPSDSCANKLCIEYNENQKAFDLLRNLVEIYPGTELGICVFASKKSNDPHTYQFTFDIAESIKESLKALGINDQEILFLGFGNNKKMHPNYEPISQLGDTDCWVELVIIEKKISSTVQSWVQYDKRLSEVDFSKGKNIGKLDDYMLACLYQLEKYKIEKPSFELFLDIHKQAINGPKVNFDQSWISEYEAKRLMSDEEMDREWEALTGWERAADFSRQLATDLINTREIRSKPGYVKHSDYFYWETEWGQRFYNGSLPADILYYAATRFDMEYSIRSYEKIEVTWEDFSSSFIVGMEYE